MTGSTLVSLRQKIQEKGYDSIIYMNEKTDFGSMGVIVLDPSQLTLVSIDGKLTDENVSLDNVTKSQMDVFDNNKNNWYNDENIITDGSHLSNGKLKSNVKYTSGEYDYIYATDDMGRICKVSIDELHYTERNYRKKHNSNTPGKQIDDHAGHLIGDRFGGSSDIDNLVSQSKFVNLSEYKKLENQWAKAIKNGQKVSVDIELKYDGDSMRPSEFTVNYFIDGKFFNKNIRN